MWTVDALALLINKVREKVDSLIVPTKVSDLTNDAGYVDSPGAAAAAPVQSVNGQTGHVTAVKPTNTYVCAGGTGPMGYGFFNSATAARIFVPIPNNASAIASVSYTGTLQLYFGNGSYADITGMSAVGVQPGGVVIAVTIAGGGTTRMPCILEGSASASIIVGMLS